MKLINVVKKLKGYSKTKIEKMIDLIIQCDTIDTIPLIPGPTTQSNLLRF